MNRRKGRSKLKCLVDGCSNPHDSRGFCHIHYSRWRRHGDPLKTTKPANGELMRWILANLSFDGDDCLIWPFNRCPRSGSALMTIKRRSINPARVICEILYGPAPTAKHEAAHSCGKAHEGCVHPKHVRWATHLENEADKKLHGTAAIGVRHGRAVLSEEKVLSIRASKGSCSEVGKQFGISFKQVSRIRRRQSWSHLR